MPELLSDRSRTANAGWGRRDAWKQGSIPLIATKRYHAFRVMYYRFRYTIFRQYDVLSLRIGTGGRDSCLHRPHAMACSYCAPTHYANVTRSSANSYSAEGCMDSAASNSSHRTRQLSATGWVPDEGQHRCTPGRIGLVRFEPADGGSARMCP